MTRPTGHDESGFALVMSIVTITIMMMLGAVVMANGSHADNSSARGRNWETSVHVAEAGAQQAIARLGATNAAPAPFTGTTSDGSYRVTTTALGRNRYRIDALGTAGKGGVLTASRRVQVVMAPPRSFRYALFSLTDVDTKNNNYVVGDIWANGSVRVEQNDTVDGSLWAATGWVVLDNGSLVTGDASTGGSDPSTGRAVDVSTNARVQGRVRASSTAPACGDDPAQTRYKVNVVGSVDGSVTTWGAKTGAGPTGPVLAGVCTAAPATKPIPGFTYNPANYSPAPVEFASPAAFNTWLGASGLKTNLSGTYFVSGGGATSAIDLNGVKIGGDTTIIATQAPISIDGGSGISAANTTAKRLVLVSYYRPAAGTTCTTTGGNPADCAIGIKNNFQPEDNTATLLYSPNGPTAFKNNAEFHGAVYANDIQLKNNMKLVYEPTVEQVVGFGPVTLEPESWIELEA